VSIDELLERLGRAPVTVIDGDELAVLSERAATLRDDDTCVAGRIRVLRVAGRVVVQEQTPDGEILLREAASEAEAARFVDDRLAVYERMWDGCGCRIDYREPLDRN